MKSFASDFRFLLGLPCADFDASLNPNSAFSHNQSFVSPLRPIAAITSLMRQHEMIQFEREKSAQLVSRAETFVFAIRIKENIGSAHLKSRISTTEGKGFAEHFYHFVSISNAFVLRTFPSLSLSVCSSLTLAIRSIIDIVMPKQSSTSSKNNSF